MIALALVGGLASLVQWLLQARGKTSELWLRRLNRTAYAFMVASMGVLVVAGFRSPV